jgi:hypothetical protein
MIKAMTKDNDKRQEQRPMTKDKNQPIINRQRQNHNQHTKIKPNIQTQRQQRRQDKDVDITQKIFVLQNQIKKPNNLPKNTTDKIIFKKGKEAF